VFLDVRRDYTANITTEGARKRERERERKGEEKRGRIRSKATIQHLSDLSPLPPSIHSTTLTIPYPLHGKDPAADLPAEKKAGMRKEITSFLKSFGTNFISSYTVSK
jgi:hypothetical protein